MTRTVLARVVSILGHPVVLMPVAALTAASAHGAPPRLLALIGGVSATIALVVLGFSFLQVRAGHWSHVDASAKTERVSLNFFLAALLMVAAVVVWSLTDRPYVPAALGLSALLVVVGRLLSRWVKMSLHAAFAAFATTLQWPIVIALIAGIVITAAVVWSRLTLRRHMAADIVAGLVLGTAAGCAYLVWVI